LSVECEGSGDGGDAFGAEGIFREGAEIVVAVVAGEVMVDDAVSGGIGHEEIIREACPGANEMAFKATGEYARALELMPTTPKRREPKGDVAPVTCK
jgi:hypothetical protein